VLAFMQDLNDRLERWVRLYSDRWYWLHRRWKTRPPEGRVRKRRARRIDPTESAE
jgi:lauroyl/myristoyl acyltransferase